MPQSYDDFRKTSKESFEERQTSTTLESHEAGRRGQDNFERRVIETETFERRTKTRETVETNARLEQRQTESLSVNDRPLSPPTSAGWSEGIASRLRLMLRGCQSAGEPNAPELDGDYLVDAIVQDDRECRWDVSYPPQLGYYRTTVSAKPNGAGFLVKAYFEGLADGPVWSAQVPRLTKGPWKLQLESRSAPQATDGVNWPQQIELGEMGQEVMPFFSELSSSSSGMISSSGGDSSSQTSSQSSESSDDSSSSDSSDSSSSSTSDSSSSTSSDSSHGSNPSSGTSGTSGGSSGSPGSGSSGGPPENPIEETCCKAQDCPCSEHPIRYFDGDVVIMETDIESSGFGTPWSHTRTYSNRMTDPFNRGQGWNWNPENWPFIIENPFPNARYAILGNLSQIPYIASDGMGGFVTLFGGLEKFSHVGNEFHWLSPDGLLTKFNDFSHEERPGFFKGWVSPGGTTLSVIPDDLNLRVVREFDDGTNAITEEFYYEFAIEFDVANLQQITLRRRLNSDPWVNVSRATYEYFNSGDGFGNEGDLKTVVRSEWANSNWQVIDTRYYRYYKPGEPFAAPHGIKYLFGPQAFENFKDFSPDPFSASNSEAAQFADSFYKYNGNKQAIEEQINGGSRTTTLSYEENPNTPDGSFNFWTRKTTQIRSDGSVIIMYLNRVGAEMLRVEKPSASSTDRWLTFSRYDEVGRVVGVAESSAITGYDEDYNDLLGWDGTAFEYLRDNEGFIRTTEYYTSGAVGYVKSESIQKGQAGTSIKQRELEYTSRTADSQTIYLVSKETTFPSDTDPGVKIETSYSYTYYSGTLQVEQKTTNWPVISTSENGSGAGTQSVEVYDKFGNIIWTKDPRGFITHIQYYPPTGAPVRKIDDVDTSLVSGVPSGWTTPSGGGLHLITDYLSDDQGRITQTLGPAHTIDLEGTATEIRRAQWTVYKDWEHQQFTAGGYVETSSGDATLINPVSITQMNFTGQPTDEILATRSSTTGPLLPSDLFLQPSYVSWKTYQYSDCCKLISSRSYHTIPTSGEGSSGTNYDETTYGYDLRDRQTRTTSPGGTISWTVFDVRGLPISSYVGTNDEGATEDDPTGGGSNPNNNMVLVTSNQYDQGVPGGDGNLTQVEQMVDASTSRLMNYGYDWRNRRVTSAGAVDLFEKSTYDNLSRITRVERYDEDETGPLLARSDTLYDSFSRVYQRATFAVDPSDGSIGNSLVDNFWFDASGNPAKSLPSGSSLFNKTLFDSLNRPSTQYTGYDVDESDYADIGNVDGDTILEQTEFTYDPASNLTTTISRQRYHDALANQTGALTGPAGPAPKARITSRCQWFDALGRTIGSADYGTNAGTAVSRPNTIPASSDTVLVSLTHYDEAGRVVSTTDPSGMVTELQYDDAGRRVKVIENVVSGSGSSGGTSSSSSSEDCPPSADTDRTTTFSYTPDGAQATVTAWNLETGNQTTTYTYGTTLSDSDIASSILLRSTTYPDSTSGSDVVSQTYNRQGQQKTVTDQRGCVHTYDYDGLGRLIHDRVTTLGSGVDGAIRRATTVYNVRGLVESQTNFDNATVGSGSVVNQVQFAYNDFGQRTISWQSHAGAVNTVTTPRVESTYVDGTGNTNRMISQTYPNGREIVSSYGTLGSMNDLASRVAALVDDDTTSLAAYDYLGLSSVVQQTSAQPGLVWTLVNPSGTNDPDTGDIYSGLDRFSRLKDVRWRKSSSDVSRVEYGYNRISNRTWRWNPSDTSNEHDWHYEYDALHRLKEGTRGTLNGSQTAITSPQFAQCWSLDETGNWSGFRQSDNGSTWTLEQERAANEANEIAEITNTVGSSWSQPAYDPAGNMTTVPRPATPGSSYTATYDAWNRLVKLQAGGQTVQENAYDARNFRVVRKDYSAGILSETRHAYFTDSWRAVEERLGSSTSPDRHFVWGQRYLDDLILRDRTTGGTLSERLYALQDANWNVTAVTNTSGSVQERYEYDPYGQATVLTAAFGSRGTSSYGWETTYAGYRWDGNTGLFAVRNRYYNATVGTWVSRDPIGYVAGSLSLYEYVAANPLNKTDSEGLAGEALPGGGWNPLNWPGMFAYPVFEVGAHLSQGTYGQELEIRAREAELDARLQSIDGRGLDDLRAGVRCQNQKPVPSSYNSLIQNVETGVAGSYGAAFNYARPHPTLSPGLHARGSIPARPGAKTFLTSERKAINELGQMHGCHTCGAKTPGTKGGDWVPDHQPPTALNSQGGAQQLYPQCLPCSRSQGGAVSSQRKQ